MVDKKDDSLVIQYMFEDNDLLFWVKGDEDNKDGISFEQFIDWESIYDKAVQTLKEKFPKGTKFIDVDED